MPALRGFLWLVGFLLCGETLVWALALPVSPGVVGMLLLTLWLARPLSAMVLGEQVASGLGHHPKRVRKVAILVVALLVGAARACLPLSLCEQDAKTGSVEIAPPPPGVESQLGLYLVYQDRRHQPQRVRLFIDALVAEFSSPSEPAQSR